MRVLIVEDEPYLAEAIRDGLRLEAIAADIAGDGDTALTLLSINAYDIAVLDRDIPGPSGDEIAARIVASGSGMPILMLTAADRLDDKALGLRTRRRRLPHQTVRTAGAGAQAQGTRPQARPQQTSRAGDRRPARRPVPPRGLPGRPLRRADQEAVRGTRSAGRRRGRGRQRRSSWNARGTRTRTPFTNAVRITVSALRKRLGEPWIIATVPGVGYRIDTGSDAGHDGGDRD
ncbi:Response regulator transcription factor OS=Streptomyces tendae OX=1932 GN=GUR47_19605 PE=4 SV=1 [Streptomyces tendae]